MRHTSEEFANLLLALSSDVVNAHIHWRIATELAKALAAHPIVIAQSNTFWSLTHQSHVATSLQCLSRAFDQEHSALHLPSLLRTIKDNLEIFDADKFRLRLKDNPFVDSLVQSAEKPDAKQLTEDIRLCTAKDPDVRLLATYRNSRAAHRSKKLALQPDRTTGTPVLTDVVVQTLLSRAHTILNRYSSMFSASMYSMNIVGKDDFKYVLKVVEAAVLRSRSSRGA
jgi:hypothetical protein